MKRRRGARGPGHHEQHERHWPNRSGSRPHCEAQQPAAERPRFASIAIASTIRMNSHPAPDLGRSRVGPATPERQSTSGQRSRGCPDPDGPVRGPSGREAGATTAQMPPCAARAARGRPPAAPRPRPARETARASRKPAAGPRPRPRGTPPKPRSREEPRQEPCFLSTANRHEVDDPSDTAPSLGKLRPLAPEQAGHVSAEGRDLLANTVENPGHGFGLQQAVPKGIEDHLLRNPTGHANTIPARTAGGAGATVVAAAVAADKGDGETAGAADHRSRQQVRRVDMHARALSGGETAPGLAARPRALDLAKAFRNPVPELLRHDAERFVVANHPLRLRFEVVLAGPGPPITAGAVLVPDPGPDVLGVLADPADGADGPATSRAETAGDVILVQPLRDARERDALRRRAEDPEDDLGLRGVDTHDVPLRPGTPVLVMRDGAGRRGAVAEGRLADEEAALLLPEAGRGTSSRGDQRGGVR